LLRLADSDLERQWLHYVNSRGDGLPERRGEATFAALVTASDYHIFVSGDDLHSACLNRTEIKPLTADYFPFMTALPR
jgi:hypothetical protein